MLETATSHAEVPATAPTKPKGLVRRLADFFSGDPDVVRLTVQPVVFDWVDGLNGKAHRLVPDLLVERRDGSRTFVTAMGRAELVKDPELDGRRKHVDAECLAAGTTFEVWTEREIAVAQAPLRPVTPASGALRAAYAGRLGPVTKEAPDIVRAIAQKAGLEGCVWAASGWVGRCALTAIPMAVLPGGFQDPITEAVIWTPVWQTETSAVDQVRLNWATNLSPPLPKASSRRHDRRS